MGPNGTNNELQSALERIVAAFARINTALRTLLDRMHRMSEASDASSERREREYETLRHLLIDIKQGQAILGQQLAEARSDVKDITPPLGVPIHSAHSDKPKQGSGSLVAFARLAEKVPTPWVSWLLKLAVSAGAGGLALRALQWIANGH